MPIPTPPIITCPQWQARKPTHPPIVCGRPDKIIEHHTDGTVSHGDIVGSKAVAEGIAYARQLQHLHMEVNGWSDSGHSFLVMRSGIVLQGRWGTVTAIEHGRMVISAHCPGQNDNPGIEHEHLPGQLFTTEQYAATVMLQAWIADRCGIRPTELYGHRVFYNTDCPDNLAHDIPRLRASVAKKLNDYKRGTTASSWRFTTQHRVKRELKR